MSTQPPCDTDPGEEIDCWNCEDKGWYVTVGGTKMPCPDCKTGDRFFVHDPRQSGKTQAVQEQLARLEERDRRAAQPSETEHADEEIDDDRRFTLPGYDPDDFTEDK